MRELSLDNCGLDKRYDIQRALGRGSYAEIFVAYDNLASTTSPHRCVVIKALNVFLQDDLDSDLERTLVENFQNEAVAFDRGSCRPVSWDEFFERFDRESLAFAYNPDANGEAASSAKLVSR